MAIMIKSFLQKNHRITFYASWLLLTFLQANFTGLQDDEAYYWVYSKFPSWGYFDHPPMIAVLIKAGTLFFTGELGVRLSFVVLSILTIVITEELIEIKNYRLFYAIILSLPILQIAGFMAVPDIPLIFFTALFFLVYRSFLKENLIKNSILLGFVMAGLLYSKYHGILVIVFTLLSNIRLLKHRAIYVSGVIGLILFIPHLIWQYDHNWITIKYHFFERNESNYDFRITLEYILGQILLTGPFAGIIFLTGTFLSRANNSFEKGLKSTAIGIFAFFLLSTLKGRVEANWTSPVIVPMIILTHNYLLQHAKWKLWLYRLLPFTVVSTLLFRFFMVVDVLPVNTIVERFHAWKEWPLVLQSKTGNLPIVFKNSYQRASQYWFHTGQIAFSLNDHRERMNNYNLWPIEDSILGKEVYVADIYHVTSFKDSIQARLWKVGFSRDSNFHSFAKLLITCEHGKYIVGKDGKLTLKIKADIPEEYKTYLLKLNLDEPIIISLFKGKDWVKDLNCTCTLQQLVQDPVRQLIIFPDLEKGEYSLLFGIGSSTDLSTANSEKIKVILK
jgi:hypothetical protein